MATPSGFTPSGYPQPPMPPPGPVRRKTSPWVWVLVALGGIVLLVVMTLGVGVWFVAHKVKQAGLDPDLMRRNPNMAAVKLITAMNPDIEVVKTDDERGVITVRNKKENKLYTINLEDAKKGKFVFQEEGKPPTTIEAKTEGAGGGVTVTTDQGTSTFGTGGKMPSWMPAYPGSTEPQGTFSANSSDGSVGNFTFKTSDSGDKVFSFYQDKLKGEGYKITTNVTDSGDKKAGMLAAENEALKRTVTVLLGTDGSETTVNLTVVEKK